MKEIKNGEGGGGGGGDGMIYRLTCTGVDVALSGKRRGDMGTSTIFSSPSFSSSSPFPSTFRTSVCLAYVAVIL
ncbi:hypothetical protein PIROE2DRAFT_16290 [Piromyces sp. E2]|nr:hypothetical protein PIROE2DRAFT_16290 [Piromyces sp. E2]|eukprot:OUM58439.1 hypothetical protein PIROE2DRAFT_16290 [Piromyces sp. E2]